MGLLPASFVPADLAHPRDRVKLAHDPAEVIHIDLMDDDSVWLSSSRPAIVASRPVGDRSARPSAAGGDS